MDETNPYAAPEAQVDESGGPGLDPYGGGELASRGSRLAAKLISGAAFAVPIMIVVPFAETGGPGETVAGLLALLIIAAVGGLNIYWLYDNGQTIGKRALGIKIVRSDRSSRASLARLLFIRGLSESVASSCCSLLWLVDVLFIFSDERQCIHDLLADTTVIVDGTAQGTDTYATPQQRTATTPDRGRFGMDSSGGAAADSGAGSSASGGASESGPSLYDSADEGPGGERSPASGGTPGAEEPPPSAETSGGPTETGGPPETGGSPQTGGSTQTDGSDSGSEENVLDLSDTSPTETSSDDSSASDADTGGSSPSSGASDEMSIDVDLDLDDDEADDTSFETDFELDDESSSDDESDDPFSEDGDDEDDDYEW